MFDQRLFVRGAVRGGNRQDRRQRESQGRHRHDTSRREQGGSSRFGPEAGRFVGPEDAERRRDARDRIDLDPSSVATHDPPAFAQAETESAARVASRIKWVEQVRAVLLGQAGAVVGDRNESRPDFQQTSYAPSGRRFRRATRRHRRIARMTRWRRLASRLLRTSSLSTIRNCVGSAVANTGPAAASRDPTGLRAGGLRETVDDRLRADH